VYFYFSTESDTEFLVTAKIGAPSSTLYTHSHTYKHPQTFEHVRSVRVLMELPCNGMPQKGHYDAERRRTHTHTHA